MYEKMDPQIKAWWLDALRSGDYKQGRSRLKDTSRPDGIVTAVHCCLGVLAEELVNNGHPLAACIHVSESAITVKGTYEGNSKAEITGILTDELADALALMQKPNEMDRGTATKSIMWVLAQHNDFEGDHHWDFNQIANWVEANL